MSFAGIRGNKGRTRGGQDQFNWEDVKNDPNRQRYLGNSLHASVGRWQENKDLTWWNENKGNGSIGSTSNISSSDRHSKEDARRREMAEIRYNEEVARCKSLNLPIPNPPSLLLREHGKQKDKQQNGSTLSEQERKKLLARRSNGSDADRITDADSRITAGEVIGGKNRKKEKKEKKKEKKEKKKKKKKKKKKTKKKKNSSDSDDEGVVDSEHDSGSDSNSDSDEVSSSQNKRKRRKIEMDNEDEMLKRAMQYLEEQEKKKKVNTEIAQQEVGGGGKSVATK
jgi:hypothetical protein